MDDIYQELYAIQGGTFVTLDKDFFRKLLGQDMLHVKQFPIFEGMPDNVFRKLY